MAPELRKRKESSLSPTKVTTTAETTAVTTATRETKESRQISGIPRYVSTPDTRHVLLKLVLFSILAIAVPLGVFYTAIRLHFSSTFAGISAAVSANVVLIGYVLVAFFEGED